MRSDEIHPGDLIAGKYRVRAILGRSHGLLVEAFHTELDQRVVIKLLLAGHGDDKEIERFRREARTLAKLESEHVARIIDVGSEPDGSFYLVRQYLDGMDLGAYVRQRGALPLDEAVLFVLQAAEAVAETHGHGIIVRELQPANLFLTQRAGGSPLVKIVDFGTAKLMRDATAPTAGGDLTATAMFGLSPFSSPELVRKAKNVDARADVWSLGAVLYFLLSGRAPFSGDTAVLMLRIMKEEPPPILELRPDLPQDADAIIGWALAKDVDARFKNVHALAHALLPYAPPEGRVLVERIAQIAQASRPRKSAGAPTFAARNLDAGEEAVTMVRSSPSTPAFGPRDAGPPRAPARPGPVPAPPPAPRLGSVPPPLPSRPAFAGPSGAEPSRAPQPAPAPAAQPGFAPAQAVSGIGEAGVLRDSQLPPPSFPGSGPAGPLPGSGPPSYPAPPPSYPGSLPAQSGFPSATTAGGVAWSPAPAAQRAAPSPFDRRVALGAIAAAAALLPALVLALVLARDRGEPSPPADAARPGELRAPAADPAAVETKPTVPRAEAPAAAQPPGGHLDSPSARAAATAPVAEPPAPARAEASVARASRPAEPEPTLDSPMPAAPARPAPPPVRAQAGAPAQRAPEPVAKAAPPKPAPAAGPAAVAGPKASSADGMGTLLAVAVGGSCAFSVNGSAKGTSSSVRIPLKAGTYTVMCRPASGVAKSKSVTVKSGETAMATFKL